MSDEEKSIDVLEKQTRYFGCFALVCALAVIVFQFIR